MLRPPRRRKYPSNNKPAIRQRINIVTEGFNGIILPNNPEVDMRIKDRFNSRKG
jgi:hypothetical protein